MLRLAIAASVGLSLCPLPVRGNDPVGPQYEKEIAPIFAARCVSCHGAERSRGGLRLDSRAAVLLGGDSGAAVVPGTPAGSSLLKRVASNDAEFRMPPKGERLTAPEIAALTAWIQTGARAAATVEDSASAKHWAFRPVLRPAVPYDSNESVRTKNPIDAFVTERLHSRGLRPSMEADKQTLIRRVTMDLTGLPPTPAEIDAFLADASPTAYVKLVERLLASSAYGERQARHWLDVVRYADSHGSEMNQPRPNAWRYRDWVIRAYNDDKPYDRFLKEQIAGDSFGADAATGFLVAGPWDQVKSPDPLLTAQQRADELHDMVSTFGGAFLGLTLGCARCHAHKFDPVPQADYYAVKAVFAGVRHGDRPLRMTSDVDPSRKLDEAKRELAGVREKLAALEPLADPTVTRPRRSPVNALRNVERFAPTKARFVRFTVLGTNSAEPCVDELEIYAPSNAANLALATSGAKARSGGNFASAPALHRLEFVNDGRYGNGRSWISNTAGLGWVEIELKESATIDRIEWGRDREGRYADRVAIRYRIEAASIANEWRTVASSDDRAAFGQPASQPPALSAVERANWNKLTAREGELSRLIAEQERGPVAYAGMLGPPGDTFRLHRGEVAQPRELVGPGGLSAIEPKLSIPPTATDAERRLALANWVTDVRNPLTARVIVNRIWQGHFGTGLVDTPSDFGRNGGKPTHPELLDWLAAELTANRWSLKHIHRLIVTSATYRESSQVRSSEFGIRNSAAIGTVAGSAGIAIPDSAFRTPHSVDPASRLLWRYPPRRLEAEAIRDAILAVSGRLDQTAGGPGFDLFVPNTNYVRVYTPKTEFGPDTFRRMVYQHRPRMHPDDTFGAFDCPDGGQPAPRRPSSTTPLQALNLLNSPFLVQQSGYFAERLKAEAKSNVKAQIALGFRLAFGRTPVPEETAAAESLIAVHGLPAFCRALFNANEFVTVR